MTTLVIRAKGKDLDPDGLFYRIQSAIPWPDDAISATRPYPSSPWQFTTRAEVLARRRERMERCLWMKRDYRVVRRVALYVWVFWCPGISGCYRGWWTYLVGRGISEGKHLSASLRSRIMELFPLVEPTLFGPGDTKKWQRKFVKQFQRGNWCGKPQGKSPVWAEVEGSSIIRLLGRAEWPGSLRET